MRTTLKRLFLIFSVSLYFISTLTSCGQKYKYPGKLEFKSIKIGDEVDTSLFKKVRTAYFPNYLDGWTMDNYDQLPDKYKELPIAIWMSKRDSGVALTLLNNIVLNITVSYLTDNEKNNIVSELTQKFGGEGKSYSYKESHPLQSWITYWDLITWKAKDVIVQIGTSNMRKPEDPAPTNVRWNMVYSDFILEGKVIDEFKKKLFSNKDDSLRYVHTLKATMNREHPPENGLFTDYYENGKIKERGNYKNQKKEGTWETWYDNGQKEDSACYKEDNLTGTRLMWFSNSQLELRSYWGRPMDRIGVWVRYYENGQMESLTHFNDIGQLDGKDLQFFENGKLKRKTTYSKEKEIEDKVWDEQGNEIK